MGQAAELKRVAFGSNVQDLIFDNYNQSTRQMVTYRKFSVSR